MPVDAFFGGGQSDWMPPKQTALAAQRSTKKESHITALILFVSGHV